MKERDDSISKLELMVTLSHQFHLWFLSNENQNGNSYLNVTYLTLHSIINN